MGWCRRGRQEPPASRSLSGQIGRLLPGGRKITRDLSDFGLKELGTCQLSFCQARFRLGYRDMQVFLLYGKVGDLHSGIRQLKSRDAARAAMLSRSRSRAALLRAAPGPVSHAFSGPSAALGNTHQPVGQGKRPLMRPTLHSQRRIALAQQRCNRSCETASGIRAAKSDGKVNSPEAVTQRDEPSLTDQRRASLSSASPSRCRSRMS